MPGKADKITANDWNNMQESVRAGLSSRGAGSYSKSTVTAGSSRLSADSISRLLNSGYVMAGQSVLAYTSRPFSAPASGSRVWYTLYAAMEQFKTDLADMRKCSSCVGACTSCTGSCNSNCSGSCVKACTKCSGSCSRHTCELTCAGSCSRNDCMGQGSGCKYNCNKGVTCGSGLYGGCINGDCSTTCSGICATTCSTTCNTACKGCTGACKGLCYTACTGCNGTCTGACAGSACTSLCTGGCSKSCESGCSRSARIGAIS